MVGGGGRRLPPHHSYYPFFGFGPAVLPLAPFKSPKKLPPPLSLPAFRLRLHQLADFRAFEQNLFLRDFPSPKRLLAAIAPPVSALRYLK